MLAFQTYAFLYSAVTTSTYAALHAISYPLIYILHTGTQGGALAGFLHPLLGLDHLLAMVAVGMLSAQIGGRAIWTVPAVFVAAMALGGAIGLGGIGLPFVEYGITGSVLALGIAILLQGNIPLAVAMLFVAFFGIFHGHAHGAGTAYRCI